MIINRHNYEELFLLLADGELSDAEQEMVLLFAKQHPDLEEELGLLMDCRLDADVPPIYPKEKLLKPIIWDVDAPDEMQSQLLDLLDNELSTAEKLELEQKIASDKGLQIEWETLQKHGKLAPEAAPFFPKERILKPTIWNVDEPDTVFVQMLDMLENELPAGKRIELEQKIAANKALEIEWQTLKQHGKLPIEAAPSYPKKKVLKPTIWNVENPDAIQLQMLALIDNEISGAEKLELEQKIAADAGLQIEWNSLQKTKLVAEAVVFPNKKELYKEKETRKIGVWLRWAAAAILLGFGAYMMISKYAGTTTNGGEFVNGNQPKKSTSAAKNQQLEKSSQTEPANNTTTQQTSMAAIGSNGSGTNTDKSITLANANTRTTNTTDKRTSTTTQNGNQQSIASTKKDGANALQKPFNNNEENNESDNQTLALTNADPTEDRQTPMLKKPITGSIVDEPSHQVEPKRFNINTLAANTAHSNETFRTASYNSTEDNTTDDEIVYVAGARINKQKVRGIFRGITRSLGRSFTKSKVEQASPTTLSRPL